MKEMEMRKFGWIVLAAFLGAAGLGGIASAGQSDDGSLAGLFDDWAAEVSRLREERLKQEKKIFSGFTSPLEAPAPPEDSVHFAAKIEKDPVVMAEKAREDAGMLNAPVRFPDIEPLQEATPLHIAAAFNPNPDILSVLIDAGADVNATENDNGATALHAALYHNRPVEIVAELLDLGADINAKLTAGKYEGMTPLHVAAGKSDKPEVIMLLVQKGANISASFSYGFWDVTPAIVLGKTGDKTLQNNPDIVALLSE